MPLHDPLSPVYLTRKDLDREREELQRTWDRWERRARIERIFGGARGWAVRLFKALCLAFSLPPRPPRRR